MQRGGEEARRQRGVPKTNLLPNMDLADATQSLTAPVPNVRAGFYDQSEKVLTLQTGEVESKTDFHLQNLEECVVAFCVDVDLLYFSRCCVIFSQR